jgi:dTDP-4-amino-4,6-dideoxygalactose transaminase
VIPFLDLGAQYRSIRSEIDEAVLSLLASTQYVLGAEVDAFERDFADYCRAKHAVAVNSGASALHLALLSAGVTEEHEVITVSSTFVATVAAIQWTGARPVLVDIDPVTCNMDPERIEAAVGPRTKAIVPVHLYGRPADMKSIRSIAERHGLSIIEDACQAHGAEHDGVRVGETSELACFSFYPGKNLGAYGDAGAITTNSDAHADKLRMLRDWGQKVKGEHAIAGFNCRMAGLQGAVLRVKLRHLDAWTDARRGHAARYDAWLDGLVTTPAPFPKGRHVYHVYAIRTADRDALRSAFGAASIHCGVHYPTPVHLSPAFAKLGYRMGDFPHSEALAREELSLPLYPEMSESDQKCVADVVLGRAQRRAG